MTNGAVTGTQERDGSGLLGVFLRVVLIWSPLVTLVIAFVFEFDNLRQLGVSLFISIVAPTLTFGLMGVLRALERRMHRPREREARARARSFAVALVTMPFTLFVTFELASALFQLPRLGSPSYKFGMLISVLTLGAFFLWKTRADAQARAHSAEFRAKEMQRQRLEAQLSALTAQVNPHLLFNALNTVAALIQSDPEKAELTVERLSELYRGVLASTERLTHSLADELRLCRAYLDVEQARFGERLTGRFEIAPDLDPEGILVPVLILQPLVENAVKHGLSSTARGGTILITLRIVERELELVVEDDGVGLGGSMWRGAGKGLATCRERLELCYEGRARFEIRAGQPTGTRIVLGLPLAPDSAAGLDPSSGSGQAPEVK